HPEYKARALAASRTIETTLFGLGWPARHRVLPNAATDRWCLPDGRPRFIARTLMRGSAKLARVAPLDRPGLLPKFQRVAVPLFGPEAPLEGADARSLDTTPLYAGDCARRIGSILAAEDVVRTLAP
ncbi:MAG: NAD(P)H-dependent flavin oxidoreductase, partial [Polyangiaceae bacterium]